MIQELEYLREIERNLCGPLGFISEKTANTPSQVWRDLFSENRWETDFKRFLAGKLAEYRNTLANMQPFDLHALNRLRTQELLGHYQMMQGVCSNVSAPAHRVDEIRFIQAFQVLTLGYISATAWEYMKPGRGMDANGFLAPFLAAGLTIDELTQSAERQGLTDADTYRQLLGASTPNRGQPQPMPKDAILNNPTAVSLLTIMQGAGLLDATYQWRHTNEQGQPIRHTNYKKAQFAFHIYSRCLNNDNTPQIPEWDKAFCDLWGLQHRTLSKAYADLATIGEKTQKRYAQMLTIFDTPTK